AAQLGNTPAPKHRAPSVAQTLPRASNNPAESYFHPLQYGRPALPLPGPVPGFSQIHRTHGPTTAHNGLAFQHHAADVTRRIWQQTAVQSGVPLAPGVPVLRLH